MSRSLIAIVAVASVSLFCASALADSKADHAALAESANKLSVSATALSKLAKASDDRGARKKFAPAAVDLSDDLAAFARRAAKDGVAFKALSTDANAIIKDAAALVEVADEIEDKDDRKSLRAQASSLQQGADALGKQVAAAAANEDKGGAKPAGAPRRFTGLLVNDSNRCSWDENVFFQIVSNGQVVWKSQLVFPGKSASLALEQGQYVVQVLKTAGELVVQKTLDAKAENWQLASGCMP